MKKVRSHGLIFPVLMLALGLSGCAATKIYSVSMSYDAQKAVIPAYLKSDPKAVQSIVGIAEFTDTRKVSDTLVIGHVIEKDGMRILVLPKYTKTTQAVAQGVRHYLKKAGYHVSGVGGPWDLREETIPQIGQSKIVIGGAIEEMDITCRKAFPTDTYKTKMKLTIVLADPAGKKIMHRATVEATTSLEHISFSEERLGEQASQAMGDAIEIMFEKKEVAQKLREILSR